MTFRRERRCDMSRFVVSVVVMFPCLAMAQVPRFVTYSGRLTDGTMWNQSGYLDLTVQVYDADVGGKVVFKGKHLQVPVVDGYFTVNIGMCDANGNCDPRPAKAAFPTSLPAQAWLTVAVGDGPYLQPLQPIGSVPYAMQCADATSVSQLDRSGLDSRYVNADGDMMTGALGLPTGGLTVGAQELVVREGKVGIGTANPQAALHIKRGGQSMQFLTGTNTSSYTLEVGVNDDAVNFRNSSSIRGYRFSNLTRKLMTITGRGYVVIGDISPVAKLHVEGDGYASGVWKGGSDARWKTDVTPVADPLALVTCLGGVRFRWTDEFRAQGDVDDGFHYGFIGQQVEECAPELVSVDDKGFYAVSYDGVAPILVEAFKALRRENDDLRARNAALEERLRVVEAMMGIAGP